MENTVIIVTGGSIDEACLRNVIKMYPNAFKIGVDHGLDAMEAYHIVPELAIGDFDSADIMTKKKYQALGSTVLLNPMKDYTDTHVAVEYALDHGAKEIILVGATGTRLDHVQGNLALLKLCRMQGVNAIIYDSHNKIQMIDAQLTLHKRKQYGNYISLIPYSDVVTGITLSGFVYELRNATMIKEETIGISNEMREEECHITIKDGYLMVMDTKD